MKKTVILAAAVLIVLAYGVRTLAAGTVSNWSVKLTFSMDGKADVYPITVGEGQVSDELLKPPPLPGFSYTGNMEDAVINAYVVSASVGKQTVKSIGTAVTNEAGRVWPVEIQVEKAGAKVSLSMDLADFPSVSGYTLSVINPDTGDMKTFDRSNNTQELFTATSAGTKTVYVMAGRSGSFAVSTGTSTFVAVRGAASMGMQKDVDVLVDGVKQGTTNASGTLVLPGLSPTTHTIRVDKPYFLGSQAIVDATAAGGSAVLSDIYAGDMNNDGVINIRDLAVFKGCFNKQAGTDGYDIKCDFNNDGVVNMMDLPKLRIGFRKCESWIAGCTQ